MIAAGRRNRTSRTWSGQGSIAGASSAASALPGGRSPRNRSRIGTTASAASTNDTAISPNTIGSPVASPNAAMISP